MQEGLGPVPILPTKTWHLLPHDPAAVDRLAAALRLSPIVAQLLLNRGLTSPDDGPALPRRAAVRPAPAGAVARRDARPPTASTPPSSRAGASASTATTTWTASPAPPSCSRCLRLLGAEPDFYVPHRLEEGYGLNAEALRQIAAGGATVVVTVDCGIASLAEAEEARGSAWS